MKLIVRKFDMIIRLNEEDIIWRLMRIRSYGMNWQTEQKQHMAGENSASWSLSIEAA